jgi:hypothetical protein
MRYGERETDIMRKLLLIIIVLVTFVFLSMGGCSLIESRVAHWTTDFNVLPSDSRILYADGAEKVADGGGAPRNYEKETIDMFLQGKYFIPEVEGSLINRSLKTTAPIGPRMFYSQSGMFVKYLANTYPENFKTFLVGIQKGKQFKENFKESFGKSVAFIFQTFIKTLTKA